MDYPQETDVKMFKNNRINPFSFFPLQHNSQNLTLKIYFKIYSPQHENALLDV